jgi:hypothetical protein
MWLAIVLGFGAMTAGCGSWLPDGQVVCTAAVTPSEQSLIIAESELTSLKQADRGLVLPSQLRVTSSTAACLDVVVLLPRHSSSYEMTADMQLTAIESALRWRYAGLGRDIDIVVDGASTPLAGAFFDDFSSEELRALPLLNMHPAATTAQPIRDYHVYCIPVVLQLREPLVECRTARMRIRDTHRGLAGAKTNDLWVDVPVADWTD